MADGCHFSPLYLSMYLSLLGHPWVMALDRISQTAAKLLPRSGPGSGIKRVAPGSCAVSQESQKGY
jgi:hypothetical protein